MLFRVLAVCGGLAAALLLSVPGLAYQGSSGASVTTCESTVAPGGSTCVIATFTTDGQPNQGDHVVFSQRNGGGNGCTVTFNPSSSTTDQSGQARSTATVGDTCRGTVDVCATDTTTGQTGCAAVLVKTNSGGGGGGGGGAGNGGSNGNGSPAGANSAAGANSGSGSTGTSGGGGSGDQAKTATSVKGAFTGGHGSVSPAVIGGSAAGLLVLLGLGLGLVLRRRGSRTVV